MHRGGVEECAEMENVCIQQKMEQLYNHPMYLTVSDVLVVDRVGYKNVLKLFDLQCTCVWFVCVHVHGVRIRLCICVYVVSLSYTNSPHQYILIQSTHSM